MAEKLQDNLVFCEKEENSTTNQTESQTQKLSLLGSQLESMDDYQASQISEVSKQERNSKVQVQRAKIVIVRSRSKYCQYENKVIVEDEFSQGEWKTQDKDKGKNSGQLLDVKEKSCQNYESEFVYRSLSSSKTKYSLGEPELIIQFQAYSQDESQQSQENQGQGAYALAKFTNIKSFLFSFVPKGKMVRCLVSVRQGRMHFQKTVQFYLVEEKKMVMVARKTRVPLRSDYLIGMVSKGGEENVGRVVSNLSRSEFKFIQISRKAVSVRSNFFQSSLYEPETISTLSKIKIEEVKQSVEQEQRGYVLFDSNLFGLRQQRVRMLKLNKFLKLMKTDRFSDIKSAFENKEYQKIQCFHNKMAEKNKKGEYILDFKEKELIQSSKNMIMQDEFGEPSITFAKKKEGLYVMNVMYPFNLCEAFFFAICNLD